jgi:hypothetical protein
MAQRGQVSQTIMMKGIISVLLLVILGLSLLFLMQPDLAPSQARVPSTGTISTDAQANESITDVSRDIEGLAASLKGLDKQLT